MVRERFFHTVLAICLVASGASAEETVTKPVQSAKKAPPKSASKESAKGVPKAPPKTGEDDPETKTAEKRVEENIVPGSRKKEPLYDVARLSPRIVVELRYATARNLAKRAIYPPGARCLVRESVAERLVLAQAWLKQNAPPGTSLKIWDGYRPAWAHKLLWRALPNKEFLGDPKRVGSLHTWGVCVDVTLCDAEGHDLKMPTDFDVFTPEAGTYYQGKDQTVRRHLHWLHMAMSAGGFLVLRDEWWHFIARDHEAFGPLDVSLTEPLKSPSR